MSKIVYRPKSAKGRIHSKDEFELCYLRHKYFRKTLYNPTTKDMAPYDKIVENLSRNTFFTYKSLFSYIGFGLEDVENIGRIHLVSFLGLFSLESDPGKYADFITTYKKASHSGPDLIDLLNKNRANFTLFLKQRMEDLVRVCRQKARNIKGTQTEQAHFFCGKNTPPQDVKKLLDNYDQYGYRKIDLSSFRTARKKAKKLTKTKFQFNDKWYIAVPIEYKRLELIDFSGSGLDPYDNIHNMTPEQILFHKQEESFWEQKKQDFRNKPKVDRVKMVSQFVKNNATNPDFQEEIKIAERYLKRLGVPLE
jgi:hypothetical protein